MRYTDVDLHDQVNSECEYLMNVESYKPLKFPNKIIA